jgi:hypothetical protein
VLTATSSTVSITFDSWSKNEGGYPTFFDVEHVQISVNGSPFSDVHGNVATLHSDGDATFRNITFTTSTGISPGDSIQYRFLYDTADAMGGYFAPGRGWAFDNVQILGAADNQAPEITCEGAVVLWSPNHDLFDVSDSFSVIDPDGDAVQVTIRVVSDESETPETGDGTGKHAPDFKEMLQNGDEGVFVRSERSGKEDGRCIIIVIEADDGNGGVTTATCVAAVCPHDETQESLDMVLAEADALAAAVDAEVQFVGAGAFDPAALGLHEHGLSDEMGPKQ